MKSTLLPITLLLCLLISCKEKTTIPLSQNIPTPPSKATAEPQDDNLSVKDVNFKIIHESMFSFPWSSAQKSKLLVQAYYVNAYYYLSSPKISNEDKSLLVNDSEKWISTGSKEESKSRLSQFFHAALHETRDHNSSPSLILQDYYLQTSPTLQQAMVKYLEERIHTSKSVDVSSLEYLLKRLHRKNDPQSVHQPEQLVLTKTWYFTEYKNLSK